MRGVLAIASLSMIGALGCADPSIARCTLGATLRCACDGGAAGAATCEAAGRFGPCVCEGAPASECVPGRVTTCACAGGEIGTHRCDGAGVFGECACHLADAGAPDASDAGSSVCDPYVSSTCGCGEQPPPSSPTVLPAPAPTVLGSGHQTLVDVVVMADGIAVVLRDEVRLLSRTGATLARWESELELLWAARDEDELIVGDRASIITLDETLVERSRLATREECTRAVVMSCDRIVCVRPDLVPRIHSYDRATRTALAHRDARALYGPPTRSVPGVDAFITVSAGHSPSDVHYQRVLESGEVILLGDSPYHGEVAANGVLAFVGWPATHIVTVMGQVLQLSQCPSALAPSPDGCLSMDGSLETLAGPHGFLALDGGENGTISALAGTATSVVEIPCPSGCRLQRIDVAGAVLTRDRRVELREGGLEVRLRHDPWADRAVLVSPMSCNGYYPWECDGWEVRLEAYE